MSDPQYADTLELKFEMLMRSANNVPSTPAGQIFALRTRMGIVKSRPTMSPTTSSPKTKTYHTICSMSRLDLDFIIQ